MTRIPVAPLLLTAAGLTPFLFGALLVTGWWSADAGVSNGTLILTRYGVIILCFVSGILWGFATKAEGPQAMACYALSVIPALWAFLNPGSTADEALINLMIGFAGVILLDLAFSRWELTPPWWMALRIPVTVVVLICLAIGVWA